MRCGNWLVLWVIACVVVTAAPGTAAAGDFYTGKRLTILVNYDAGGPTDLEARLIARHLGRHIPGAPTIIVQNMGGAAGFVATKYLGEIAPRDGTMMGYLTAAPHRYAFSPEKFTVDLRTYEFIAYVPSGRVHFVRSDLQPGIKAPIDLMTAKGIVAGGLNAESLKDLAMRMVLDLLGVPYRYVTGYNSGAQGLLALQRGEINYFLESSSSYFAKVEPLVKAGKLTPVYVEPGYDGSTFTMPRELRHAGLPLFTDYYRSVGRGEPSGELWDAYRSLLTVSSSLLRVLALPPGAPPEAVAALRAGIVELNEDRAYQEEASRTINEAPEYVSGPGINAAVAKGVTVPPRVRAFIEDYVLQASKP